MATIHVNNNVLTLFSANDTSVIKFTDVDGELVVLKKTNIQKTSSTTDPYMGLTTFCAIFSNDGMWYAIADDRDLIVWSTTDWTKKCTKVLERCASRISFMPSNVHILVADKTGDIYLFSLLDDLLKGTLLMGHLSIPLDICVSIDGKHLVTCDRDDKIRVTCYPNTYNIESFCLGHEAFVTRILFYSDDVLLSSSGDGTLKFWDYLNGVCLATKSIREDIKKKLEHTKFCIITNFVLLTTETNRIICLSIHKFNGILVYRCDNYKLSFIQMLNCAEPLDFTTNGNCLWILSPSKSILSVFRWSDNNLYFTIVSDTLYKSIGNLVANKCSYLSNYSHVDLTVLNKKLKFKELCEEEKYKRLKI